MAITFPANPSQDQIYTAENGVLYKFIGVKWQALGETDNSSNFRDNVPTFWQAIGQ